MAATTSHTSLRFAHAKVGISSIDFHRSPLLLDHRRATGCAPGPARTSGGASKPSLAEIRIHLALLNSFTSSGASVRDFGISSLGWRNAAVPKANTAADAFPTDRCIITHRK